MTKFTSKEVGILLHHGYSRIADDEFRNVHIDGDYETIVKDSEDEFSYYYDVADYKDDIDRANGGHTEYDLTWEDLIELYL